MPESCFNLIQSVGSKLVWKNPIIGFKLALFNDYLFAPYSREIVHDKIINAMCKNIYKMQYFDIILDLEVLRSTR